MSEAVATGAGFRDGLPRVLSDERLARRAVRGDERAFTAIFDRYHQRLYRYCLAIVGDVQDAQDALQNTMIKVLRALPGEERRIELKPWLYRIAHNESIDLLRRRRETRQLDAELVAPGSGLAEEAATRERLRRLLSDLDELPERQRDVLVMRELAGLEFSDIGATLGTSPAVARQTLYEARLSLRQMDEGREMNCAEVMKALSDGDGRVGRRRDLRAHLRSCAGCRRFGEEIETRQRDFATFSPLPAIAAAGLLQGLLGAGAPAGAGGGGVAAAAGAVKTAGASLALKGAATVAVVGVIGLGAADRGGLIDLGSSGGDRTPAGGVGKPVGAGVVSSSEAGTGAKRASGGDDAGAAAALAGSAPARSAHGSVRKDLPADSGTGTAPMLVPDSRNSAPSHPHGKSHEKRLPSPSAHGQQTAATHKAVGNGSAGAKSHPAKPAHPAHPSTPSDEKPAPAAPPNAAAPGPKPQDNSAPPAASGASTAEQQAGQGSS